MNTTLFDAAVAGDFRDASSNSVMGGLLRWLSYRDTVAELSNLTPTQLSELGVKGDVDAHAWRLASR